MSEDVIIQDINISAMQRNFKKMAEVVKTQGEMLNKQKDRIVFLEREIEKKQDDTVRAGYQMLNKMMNKKGN